MVLKNTNSEPKPVEVARSNSAVSSYCYVCETAGEHQTSEELEMHKENFKTLCKYFVVLDDKFTCLICLAECSLDKVHQHANKHGVTWINLEVICHVMHENLIGFSRKKGTNFCFLCHSDLGEPGRDFHAIFEHVRYSRTHKKQNSKFGFQREASNGQSTLYEDYVRMYPSSDVLLSIVEKVNGKASKRSTSTAQQGKF